MYEFQGGCWLKNVDVIIINKSSISMDAYVSILAETFLYTLPFLLDGEWDTFIFVISRCHGTYRINIDAVNVSF